MKDSLELRCARMMLEKCEALARINRHGAEKWRREVERLEGGGQMSLDMTVGQTEARP